MGDEIKCTRAVYDIFWKKYKCTVFQHVIFEQDTCNGCLRYREKEISSDNVDNYHMKD